uniref:Uncharacterized protein n=1 Tax=Anguilla anguilla TaxID=7936 RepID=A0A0E9VQQ4_ANGAN
MRKVRKTSIRKPVLPLMTRDER